MTSEVETFVENPSDDLLDGLTREKLDQVATHYGIEVNKNDTMSKVSLKVTEGRVCFEGSFK